jgi:hypothetical protein
MYIDEKFHTFVYIVFSPTFLGPEKEKALLIYLEI